MKKTMKRVMLSVLAASVFGANMSYAAYHKHSCNVKRGPGTKLDLPITTQGPFWPPAEVVDEDGNFILIGQSMTEVQEGVFAPVPNQAVLVSKNTVPALDENGIEDADNWFGAAYDVIRPLNLKRGSKDLEMVLNTVSFGPAVGNFGRAPRIPMEGDSAYNLNGDLAVCRDAFPALSQAETFKRKSFPLHQAPVFGFQGDNLAYNADTGEPFDPQTTTGPGCELGGCPGEDAVDQRREKPITLGEWIKARGKLNIRLLNYDYVAGGYTHAKFNLKLRKLLPNSLYTVWAVRLRQVPIPGVYERRDIDPIAVPNVITTDARGNARASFTVKNPFPDAETDALGQRIIGLSVVYHSDHQTWGACFGRLGPGVDAHAVFSTLANGNTQITDFNTVAPSKPVNISPSC